MVGLLMYLDKLSPTWLEGRIKLAIKKAQGLKIPIVVKKNEEDIFVVYPSGIIGIYKEVSRYEVEDQW